MVLLSVFTTKTYLANLEYILQLKLTMRETVTENPGGKKKSDLKYVYIIFLQGIYSSVLEMNLSNVFYSPQASQAVRVNS